MSRNVVIHFLKIAFELNSTLIRSVFRQYSLARGIPDGEQVTIFRSLLKELERL